MLKMVSYFKLQQLYGKFDNLRILYCQTNSKISDMWFEKFRIKKLQML